MNATGKGKERGSRWRKMAPGEGAWCGVRCAVVQFSGGSSAGLFLVALCLCEDVGIYE